MRGSRRVVRPHKTGRGTQAGKLNMNRTMVSLAGVLSLGVSGLAGCAGHSTYPGAEAANLDQLSDPNEPNAERVVTTALQYVLAKHRSGSVNEPIAVNLPPGLRRAAYERIASRAGANVQPLTEEIAAGGTVPVYHVGRVLLRGKTAKVDVLRPMGELPRDPKTGKPVYQTIEVSLEGGLQPWRATYSRTFSPGAFPSPQYYVMPPTDDPFQFQHWKEMQQTIAQSKEEIERQQRLEQGSAPVTSVPVPDEQPAPR